MDMIREMAAQITDIEETITGCVLPLIIRKQNFEDTVRSLREDCEGTLQSFADFLTNSVNEIGYVNRGKLIKQVSNLERMYENYNAQAAAAV